MRDPKAVIEAILRDLAYDDAVRARLGVTRDELTVAARWLGLMP